MGEKGGKGHLADPSVEDRVPHQLLFAQILFQEGEDKNGSGCPNYVVEREVDAIVERLYREVVVEAVEEDAGKTSNVFVEEVVDK